MTVPLEVPDGVQWHEGMMLAPQHFQQQALRHERALQFHLSAGLPFHWGLLALLLDRVALVTGTVRVLELDAVMPDGTIVRHRPGAGADLDLDLTSLAEAAADVAVTIHLAVPAAKPSGVSAPGDLPRYRSVEGPAVPDESTGEGEIRIPRLQHRLSLIATVGPTQKPPQKFTTMPIAELAFQNDAFVLTEYEPPSLAMPEESVLGRMCADLARRAREKALFLLDQIGSADGAQTANVREARAEIQGLVTNLPQLEALLATGSAHPLSVYLVLCGMVGSMAASGTGTLPPVLGRYDHNNCRPAFAEIRDYMMRSLERVRESVSSIAFQLDNDRFSLTMQAAWLDRALVVAVRPSVSMTEQDLITWMRGSLIASRSKIETLWEMRVMGAGRRPIDGRPDLDVARSRGAVLFEIDTDGDLVLPDEPLDIWNADGRGGRRRPLEIVLYYRAAGEHGPVPGRAVARSGAP